jgi:hypothetical protein
VNFYATVNEEQHVHTFHSHYLFIVFTADKQEMYFHATILEALFVVNHDLKLLGRLLSI